MTSSTMLMGSNQPKTKKTIHILYPQLNPNNLWFVDGNRLRAHSNGHGHLGTQLNSINFSCFSMFCDCVGKK